MTIAERINRTAVKIPGGCWEWPHVSPGANGYARMTVGSRSDGTRRTIPVHRAAFAAFNGSVPQDLCVLHKCDNRRCVNPEHLFLGTYLDNAKDRDAKGRGRYLRGEANRTAKLTVLEVTEMRRLKTAGISFQVIADTFRVDKKTAFEAIKGVTWNRVPLLSSPPQEKP